MSFSSFRHFNCRTLWFWLHCWGVDDRVKYALYNAGIDGLQFMGMCGGLQSYYYNCLIVQSCVLKMMDAFDYAQGVEFLFPDRTKNTWWVPVSDTDSTLVPVPVPVSVLSVDPLPALHEDHALVFMNVSDIALFLNDDDDDDEWYIMTIAQTRNPLPQHGPGAVLGLKNDILIKMFMSAHRIAWMCAVYRTKYRTEYRDIRV